jgi:hypothetical protein
MTKKEQRNNSIEVLKELIEESNATSPEWTKDRVYIIQRSVSRSGMTRKLSLYLLINNEPRHITHLVADALEWGLDKNYRLIVNGCGMDMHFHTVYSLSQVLYRDTGLERAGYKLRAETL